MKDPKSFNRQLIDEAFEMIEKEFSYSKTQEEMKLDFATHAHADLALAMDKQIYAPPCDTEDLACSNCYLNNYCVHKHKSEQERMEAISEYIMTKAESLLFGEEEKTELHIVNEEDYNEDDYDDTDDTDDATGYELSDDDL